MSTGAFARRDAVVLGAVSFVGVLLILSTMTTVTCARNRDVARQSLCAGNLRSLARGVALYSQQLGSGLWPPFPLGRGTAPSDFNGAEWLASLYWTRLTDRPTVFLCPGTTDTNWAGRDIGSERAPRARFGGETVSYAGMHFGSLITGRHGGTTPLTMADFPPDLAMACDDTQGSINHGRRRAGGMNVVFFDHHVEFRSSTEFQCDVDLLHAVGSRDGLLGHLKN